MKYISKYRRLRVVLRPTIRQVEEVAGEKISIVHPPLVAEFNAGIFDSVAALSTINSRIQCCDRHKLKNVEQLDHYLQACPDFGNSFNFFYEPSPKEIIAAKKKELAELEAQYGITSDEPVDPPSDKKTDDVEDEEEVLGDLPVIGDEEEEDELPPKQTVKKPVTRKPVVKGNKVSTELKQLQEEFKAKFGFEAPNGATTEQINQMLGK